MSRYKKFLLKSAVFVSALFFTITLTPSEALAEIKLIYRYNEPAREQGVPYTIAISPVGTTVYILLYSDIRPFIVMDVSDPHNIKKINEYSMEKDTIWQSKPASVRSSGIWQTGGDMDIGDFEGRKLAFITTSASIQVLDCTDPYNMFSLGTNPDYAGMEWGGERMVEVKSPYIFVSNSGGFRIFEYSTLAASEGKAPYEHVADVGPGYTPGYSLDFEFSKDGRYLYLSGFFGLDAYDITYINKPVLVFEYGNINSPYKSGNKGISVKADKNLLFLGTSRDLRIFDISNPAIPKPLKDDNNKDTLYPTLGPVLDIALYGKYVFLFYGPIEDEKPAKPQDIGLEIVDISDPRLPEFIDAFILGPATRFRYNPKQKMALVPEAGLAILGSDTFYILDVSDYIK
jgi:hypothetical protein